MSESFSRDPYAEGPEGGCPPPKSSGIPKWLLILFGVFFVCVILPCGGLFAWALYIGTVGPETSVYLGNEVPSRFVTVMKKVGALDDDESIHYFYSDALTNIRNGFYFVSDKKVVVYNETHVTPLTIVRFDEIEDMDIYRDESFFTDSEITLDLSDGRPIAFPVSSEQGRDERFFQTIEAEFENVAGGEE